MSNPFVNIDGSNVSTSSMRNEIENTIAYTRTFADEMRVSLSTGIENLNAVVGTYNPEISEIDTTVPTIDGPTFPARPSFGELGLDDNWPADLPLAPIFMDYGDMDFSFVTPSAPDEIDGNFDWSATEYSSEMWQALFTKVHSDILNGGTGLSGSVHAIIIAREQYARKTNQDREYRRGLDAVGARGFNLPSGQIAAFQRDIASDIIGKDQDALNNITVKDFEMATENTRFAITTGAELEKVLRSTYDASETRGLEAKKATKEYLIQVYDANIKAYLAKWDGVKIRMESLKAKIEGIASYNDGNTKVYLGQAQVFEAQINAIVEKNRGLVDARKGEVDVYSAEVQAVATEYGALVEEIKVKMEGVRLEIISAIEEEKINLSAYQSKAQLTEKVAEAVSNISAQAVASALGAISASMSNDYSATESRREGWTHTENLSESHDYDES